MPCSVPSSLLSARQRVRRRPSRSSPRLLAKFNLGDPAEQDAFRWVASFHGDKNSIYRLLSIHRGQTTEGQRAIWMLTRSCAARLGARPRWLVITYLIDEIYITLPSYRTLQVARAAFREASRLADRVEMQKLLSKMAGGGWEVHTFTAIADPVYPQGRKDPRDEARDNMENLGVIYVALMRRGGVLRKVPSSR